MREEGGDGGAKGKGPIPVGKGAAPAVPAGVMHGKGAGLLGGPGTPPGFGLMNMMNQFGAPPVSGPGPEQEKTV